MAGSLLNYGKVEESEVAGSKWYGMGIHCNAWEGMAMLCHLMLGKET
jgi:hypothetical protein